MDEFTKLNRKERRATNKGFQSVSYKLSNNFNPACVRRTIRIGAQKTQKKIVRLFQLDIFGAHSVLEIDFDEI